MLYVPLLSIIYYCVFSSRTTHTPHTDRPPTNNHRNMRLAMYIISCTTTTLRVLFNRFLLANRPARLDLGAADVMFGTNFKVYRVSSTLSLFVSLASLLEPCLGFSINEKCTFKTHWTAASSLRVGEASTLGHDVPNMCATRTVSIHACRGVSASLRAADKDDESPSSAAPTGQLKDELKTRKAQSPLAMAAQDWLEDDDEDELFAYWDRFDEKKSDAKMESKSNVFEMSDAPAVDRSLSTDELLDQYYKGRGIDKRVENKHRNEIQKALNAAKMAKSAREAVRFLEEVRPWLQTNTKLGGDISEILNRLSRA